MFHHGDRPVVLGTRKHTTTDAAPRRVTRDVAAEKLDLNKSAGIARPSSVKNGKAVMQPEPQSPPLVPQLSMQRAVQAAPPKVVQQQQSAALPVHEVHVNLGENARLASINGADLGAMSEEDRRRLGLCEEAIAVLAQGEEAPAAPVAVKVEQPAPSRDRALLRAAIAETRWARQQYDTNLRVNRLNEANRKHYEARAQRDEQARRR